MRNTWTITIACLYAATTPALAAESAPIALAQDGAWVANYDADSCQLLGKFGTGNDSIIARFTRYQPSNTFDLALMGNGLKLIGGSARIKLAFGPGQADREVWASLGTSRDKPLILFNSLRLDGWTWTPGKKGEVEPSITPEQEAAVSSLAVRLDQKRNYRLELGRMGAPMAAMRTCMDNLLQHWGYDPAIVKALSRPVTPIGNPGNWITTNDYPRKAYMQGHRGIVQFRLDVDETGKIIGCNILARTNPDEFADLSCSALQRRAKLLPALDAAGKPVKGYYISKIRFELPDD